MLTTDNRHTNLNADIETPGASQTTVKTTVSTTEKELSSGVVEFSDLDPVGHRLSRTNQTQTTFGTSLISEEETRPVDCKSASNNRVSLNKSIVMTSSSDNLNIDNLPDVDAPDACDKAAFR